MTEYIIRGQSCSSDRDVNTPTLPVFITDAV